MELVIDANILVSFFRNNPVRFIIINSKSFELEIFSPEYAFEELRRNIPDLIKYSKLESRKVESVIEGLKGFITVIPLEEFKQYNEQAKKLSPHDKDVPYFALALKLDCAIWSNEPGFKKQSLIKVFSTSDLIKELNL